MLGTLKPRACKAPEIEGKALPWDETCLDAPAGIAGGASKREVN